MSCHSSKCVKNRIKSLKVMWHRIKLQCERNPNVSTLSDLTPRKQAVIISAFALWASPSYVTLRDAVVHSARRHPQTGVKFDSVWFSVSIDAALSLSFSLIINISSIGSQTTSGDVWLSERQTCSLHPCRWLCLISPSSICQHAASVSLSLSARRRTHGAYSEVMRVPSFIFVVS